jgi:hypothetical protein
MNILQSLDAIFIRLSVIPGLGFLHDYVHELQTQKHRRRQMVDTYKGYGQALREAGQATRNGGQGEASDHAEQKGRGKPGKRGKSARPAAKPSRGGQVARTKQGKEDDPSDLEEDYYEDDDFESYLQH